MLFKNNAPGMKVASRIDDSHKLLKLGMFKNLKKRIEQQGGNVGENERSPFPGHASPLVTKSQSLLSLSASATPTKTTFGYESDTNMSNNNPGSGVSSPTFRRDEPEGVTGNSEDIVSSLMKRTEQCRKLEAKIKEYASIIKEKNKNIEKLEASLQQQEDDRAKTAQEMYDQYQASQAKLSEGFTLALQKKDEEKEELLKKMREIEEFKDKFYRKEEENDEIQGLAKQELAKVKHLLINTQEEVTKLKVKLETTSKDLETAEKKVSKQVEELVSIQAQNDHLKVSSEQLKKDHDSLSASVATLTGEKEKQGEIIKQLTTEMSQYEGLQRNYDQHKNKTGQLLEEKDDHIAQLQERVTLLEQRFQDQSLSGDDRVQALETERDSLERKLEEARQQLSEIKSSWSSKISLLEQQIANLNKKIVEDSEELQQSQKLTETTRDNLTTQINDLQKKLKETESRSEDLTQLIDNKEAQFNKAKHELESEVRKSHFEKIDLETQLRSKITSLESQLETLEETKDSEKNVTQHKILQLESQQQKYMESVLKLEKEVEMVEQDRDRLMNENIKKTEETLQIQKQLQDKDDAEKQLTQKVNALEDQLRKTEEHTQAVDKFTKESEAKLQSSEKEKGDLLLRNTELSQEMVHLTTSARNEKQELQQQIKDQECQVESLQQEIKDKGHQIDGLNERIKHYEKQIEDLEGQRQQSAQKSSEMSDLHETVASLEEQLADKNKALKKQEQRLSDLKKTLQRELKVQALPNDEPLVLRGSQAPPLQRNSPSARHSPPKTSSSDMIQGSANLSWTSEHNSDKQINFQTSVPSAIISSGVVNNTNSRKVATPHLKEETTEINFQYLKHVVLKFMLSRESEAIHLIRAVSVLLHFTKEEQKLIRETLEWKMSWFGNRPQAGIGQQTKFIPPSY